MAVSVSSATGGGDPIILGSMVTSALVVSAADYKQGDFPPPASSIVSLGLVYLILGAVTITDNRLGRMLAVAVMVGIVIKDLPKALGKGKPVKVSTSPFTTGSTDITGGNFPGTGQDSASGGALPGSGKPPTATGRGTHN